MFKFACVIGWYTPCLATSAIRKVTSAVISAIGKVTSPTSAMRIYSNDDVIYPWLLFCRACVTRLGDTGPAKIVVSLYDDSDDKAQADCNSDNLMLISYRSQAKRYDARVMISNIFKRHSGSHVWLLVRWQLPRSCSRVVSQHARYIGSWCAKSVALYTRTANSL